MVHVNEVRAQVAASYARLGLPSWPDPHPAIASPVLEEYSRVTSPERYRVVEARASVWAEVLSTLPSVEVEPVALTDLDRVAQAGGATAGVRVSSTRLGTLPLLLVTEQVPLAEGGQTMAVLRICVDRASVVLASAPECGCDACDSGSHSLLEAIDDTISEFVGGPSVLLRGPDWYADWRPGGGSSGGEGRGPDHDQMMQLCRRLSAGEAVPLPQGSEAFVSTAWLR